MRAALVRISPFSPEGERSMVPFSPARPGACRLLVRLPQHYLCTAPAGAAPGTSRSRMLEVLPRVVDWNQPRPILSDLPPAIRQHLEKVSVEHCCQ